MRQSGATVIVCRQGENISSALLRAGITPDIEMTSADLPDDKTLFFHRRTADEDIYFIYNHSPREFNQSVALRATGNHIELWNPKTATRSTVVPNADGRFALQLSPYQSVFVVVSADKI